MQPCNPATLHSATLQPCPRILIAGQSSGVGKTTITLGLIAAFRRRGLTVQPFKCGPDYIDPTYHALAADRPCRNLDTWMLSPQQMIHNFERATAGSETTRADLAIIEGVMGLYDGSAYDAETGSAAHIAKLLNAPVLLILDIAKLARSAGALALGYQQFDPDLNLAACILNRAGSQNHADGCRQAIAQSTNLPTVGWLSKHSGLTIPERHLGLIPTIERPHLTDLIASAADAIETNFDLDKIFCIAQTRTNQVESGPIISAAQPNGAAASSDRPPITNQQPPTTDHQPPTTDYRSPLTDYRPPATDYRPPILAVARDAAFSFYYPDNIDLLIESGARVQYFSPLTGDYLPPNASGLYLGGGFPEIYAAQLSANQQLWQSIRNAHARGLPIYAECGGFMVLTQSLTDLDGNSWPFAGIVPGQTHMQPKLATLGYRVATATADNLLLSANQSVRGHEFHYSNWTVDQAETATHNEIVNHAAWTMRRRATDTESKPAGYAIGNLLASYLHIHFSQDPTLAERFVSKMVQWQKTHLLELTSDKPAIY